MNVYTASFLCWRQMVKPMMGFQNIIMQRFSNKGGEESRKKGMDGHEKQERLPRAPSTAEQFERVAQEKAKHGLESHKDSTIGDSSQFDQTYKGPVGKPNSHKTEDV